MTHIEAPEPGLEAAGEEDREQAPFGLTMDAGEDGEGEGEDEGEDGADRAADGLEEQAPVSSNPEIEERRALFAAAADAGEAEQLRMLEALLFAAAEPLDEGTLAARMPADIDLKALLATLQERYEGRGVELVRAAGGWRLQTPADLAWLLEDVKEERRKLSGAARETLAIIAYHQPVTRAEIEEVRGVAVSKGTVDMLMELGWVRMRGRRRAPGRPVTYGTTDLFLSHFGLESLGDLPGKAELKSAGLLDSRVPADFQVPDPTLFDPRSEEPLDDTEGVEDGAFHVDFLEDEADEDDAPAQAKSA